MDERLSLSLAQRQQQVLTPLQMQYVRMLEMSGPEVEEQVRETLADNPALEAVPESEPAQQYDESADQMQLADYRTPDEIPPGAMAARRSAAATYDVNLADRNESLYDYIMSRLSESESHEQRLAIARYIAGNIDDNGYMTRSLDSIASDIAIDTGIDVPIEEVREVWMDIRSIDPAGIGAVDLRDCLLEQVKRIDNSRVGAHTAREILTHYFDLFSKMHFDRLRAQLNVDEREFDAALRLIRGLNPKPGALVGGGADDPRLRHISPDFIVESDAADASRLTITIPNNIPALQIEKSFAVDSLTPGRGADEAMLFIRQKRDEANTFMRVLAMRRDTLMAVMTAIVSLQRDFFLTDDPSRLRPMILKDVAQLTNLDLSVISRATSGKYVATQRGIYPLRYFFSERPSDQSDVSTHQILDAIKQIVDEEDKAHPLADVDIAKKLEQRGLGIARRTVAKYRERLGLPVGRLRRKH